MAAMTIDTIRARVTSLLTRAPFRLAVSPEPYSFDRVPNAVIDGSFGLESESLRIEGGSSYTEVRTDRLTISVARQHQSQPEACYQALLADSSSITAALVRDGAELGGDYDVPDEGRGYGILHDTGRAFSLLRLTLPVEYEAQL